MRSSASLEDVESVLELKKSAEAMLKKLGGQAKELDLVLEVIKSNIRIFGKLILEAVCEEWIKTKGKELGSCCNIQMRDYCDLKIGWRGRLDKEISRR